MSQIFADPSRIKAYRYLRCHGLGIEPFENWNLPWLKKAGIKTIIDIGAHTGESFLLLKYIFNDCNIYSFEPLYDSFTILNNRVRQYPGSRAFNTALGDFNGITDFYQNDFKAASSRLKLTSSHKELLLRLHTHPEAVNETKVEVPIARLDDFCVQEHLDLRDNILIKLDVQGYEDKVMLGGENIFKRAKVVISEVSFSEIYISQVLFVGIYKLMNKFGFRFYGFLSIDKSPIDGKLLQADAIFIRE